MAGDGATLTKLAAAWFLFFTVKYHIDLLRCANWPSTVGNLTKFRYLGSDGSHSPAVDIRFDYNVDGQTYTGHSANLAMIRFGGNSSGPRRKKQMSRVERIGDDQVVVFYNPRKPQKNLLLKPSRSEYLFLLVLYLATFGAAYLGFFYIG